MQMGSAIKAFRVFHVNSSSFRASKLIPGIPEGPPVQKPGGPPLILEGEDRRTQHDASGNQTPNLPLFTDDGIRRASPLAGPAIDAFIGVDLVDRRARGDRSLRTFILTTAARGTFICDFISHGCFF
jgi:hypothetical protein